MYIYAGKVSASYSKEWGYDLTKLKKQNLKIDLFSKPRENKSQAFSTCAVKL